MDLRPSLRPSCDPLATLATRFRAMPLRPSQQPPLSPFRGRGLRDGVANASGKRVATLLRVGRAALAVATFWLCLAGSPGLILATVTFWVGVAATIRW